MTLKVVSLLPGATEIVAAIGGLPQLVGISHECDWPTDVAGLPRVTVTPIDTNASSGAIHAAVATAAASGIRAVMVDAALIAALNPDVIITQQLCEVCAVADSQVHQLADVMARPPRIVVMSGRTLDGVWDDIRTIGIAIGRHDAAVRVADELARQVTNGAPPTHVLTGHAR